MLQYCSKEAKTRRIYRSEHKADAIPLFLLTSSNQKGVAKIPHFLKIVEFYKSLADYEQPRSFIVEPKFGKKGRYMEPDAFMIWKAGPFFVEIQRSVYSENVMKEKVKRYEDYYLSKEWKEEAGSHTIKRCSRPF